MMFKDEKDLVNPPIFQAEDDNDIVYSQSRRPKSEGNSSSEMDDREFEITNMKNKKKKNTFVGTAEYVAPEVLGDREVGPETDLWALGCILYHIFSGTSPFKEKTEYLIFQKILELKFNCPDSFPEAVKDLISCFIVKDPKMRLGSCSIDDENDFKSLKKHPFFTGVDFDNLLKNNLPPHHEEFIMKVGKKSEDLKSHGKSTLMILKQDIIEKKSPWFHYNKRKLVLDSSPKIDYIDPDKNVVKGAIYLNKLCFANFVDINIFDLVTPKRTFRFRVE